MRNSKRIVVKVGTSTLTHPNGTPNLQRLGQLVRVLIDIRNAGTDVVLVTSGAIGIGAAKIGYAGKPAEIALRQACAAVGQCDLMKIYDHLFSEFSACVAQVLVTKDVMENEKMRVNAQNTIDKLLEYKAFPIVNENDSVAIEEVVYGDNDTLSAVVAELIGAELLIILTDTDGLYDKNPAHHSDALLIPLVTEITEDIRALAGDTSTNKGTGGMITKLQAADMATRVGIETIIANGVHPELLYDLTQGKGKCTVFAPLSSTHQ